jgi:hypothetical protein
MSGRLFFCITRKVGARELSPFEGLELGEGKPSRPVLRGPGGRKAVWLLGTYEDGAPKPNSVGSNSPALPVNVSSKDARLSGSSGPT